VRCATTAYSVNVIAASDIGLSGSGKHALTICHLGDSFFTKSFTCTGMSILSNCGRSSCATGANRISAKMTNHGGPLQSWIGPNLNKADSKRCASLAGSLPDVSPRTHFERR